MRYLNFFILATIGYTILGMLYLALSHHKQPIAPVDPSHEVKDSLTNLLGVEGREPSSVKAPLWQCTCSNMSQREQLKKGCSMGFAFDTMLSAIDYAREKCGQDCVPNCSSNGDTKSQ